MELSISSWHFFQALESSPFYNLLIYTFLVFIYALFVWKFYKFMAKQDILKLDLTKYNRAIHPTLKKIVASVLFFVEYILILPFVIFFWFAILATLLLLLSRQQSIQQILFISAVFISAVRISAYINEDLAKEIAKILPLTALAVFALNPSFFMIPIVDKIKGAIAFLPHITLYLIFIFGVEVLFRFISLLVGRSSEGEQTEAQILT